MSAPPIDPALLRAAGWENAELIWEQIQAAAAGCQLRGTLGEAAELWAGALEVAREHFAANDARLATSLVNHALGCRHAHDGVRLLIEARQIWEASRAWVEALAPERRARSSVFHLRLESKHPHGYAHFSRTRFAALAAEGRERIEAHLAGESPPGAQLERWRAERPAGFDDHRKLLGAVLLMG